MRNLLAMVLVAGCASEQPEQKQRTTTAAAQPEGETTGAGVTPEQNDAIDALFKRKAQELQSCWQDEYEKTHDRKMEGNITVGVRPESWRIVSANEGGLPITVTVVEELGADGFVYGTCDVEGTPSNVIVRVNARDTVHKGDVIYVTTDPKDVHVFDTETGARLSD